MKALQIQERIRRHPFPELGRLDIEQADKFVRMLVGGEGQLKNIIRIGPETGTQTGRVTVKGGVDWAKHPGWSLKYHYDHYYPPGKAIIMEGDICSQEGSDILKSRILQAEDMIDMAVEYKDGKAVRLVPMTEVMKAHPPTPGGDVLILESDEMLFGRIKFGMNLKDGGQLKTIIKL